MARLDAYRTRAFSLASPQHSLPITLDRSVFNELGSCAGEADHVSPLSNRPRFITPLEKTIFSGASPFSLNKNNGVEFSWQRWTPRAVSTFQIVFQNTDNSVSPLCFITKFYERIPHHKSNKNEPQNNSFQVNITAIRGFESLSTHNNSAYSLMDRTTQFSPTPFIPGTPSAIISAFQSNVSAQVPMKNSSSEWNLHPAAHNKNDQILSSLERGLARHNISPQEPNPFYSTEALSSKKCSISAIDKAAAPNTGNTADTRRYILSSPWRIIDIPSDSTIPEKSEELITKSTVLRAPGPQCTHYQISLATGMNVSSREATEYLKIFSERAGVNASIIYDHSNSPIIDTIEIFGFNYQGFSTTAFHCIKEWTDFHEANRNNPDAKILQECHSKGAINVKIALQNVPREIQQRVIVLALAPAAIIPKDLCYESFNYVSKRDFVPYGEMFGSLIQGNFIKLIKDYKNFRDNVIYLTPHPEAPPFDHPILSPTYTPIIELHTSNYLEKYSKEQK